ncbi:LysR family transcriptional regulator [Streptomyces sp. SID3343]|uniref:LysR family transcriptional regulator n=1 Tax=Streptomyces sp. SID3343 TaxID=2690260 RepID=UPI0013695BE3|nr:LysR family transcriptional regulator [Streptomyces sp. SID3343]MYW05907.1 LysR family transcriptional regulator [Streptomyces sp. SID3343]
MDAHLRDLRYFVATAEELNFTRAAERLFVSQPALSKQIRQLEQQSRARLFERDRTVRLTPAGEALLPLARELLKTWDAAQRAMADAAASAAVLTLGVSTSVGRGLLPALRERLAQRRPDCRIRIRQVDWEDATAGLAGGDVDAALLWLPFPGQESYGLRCVAQEERWVAMPATHPLAARDSVAFADLLDEPFLALPPTAGALRDFWLAHDQRAGHPIRIGAVVHNADETFEAIEEGSGIVLLSAGNAAIYSRPGVVALPVTGLTPSRLALVWRVDDRRPVVQDLVACCPEVDAATST